MLHKITDKLKPSCSSKEIGYHDLLYRMRMFWTEQTVSCNSTKFVHHLMLICVTMSFFFDLQWNWFIFFIVENTIGIPLFSPIDLPTPHSCLFYIRNILCYRQQPCKLH